ncbi:hypothetical protein GCM10023156_29180 [Novipirellula rosea]|uniref:Uncharacterized protein n=1 Tax=Novipirellula rosea TaxID=1031540 RepID=A0ABP8MW41_9BACT
MTDDSQKRSGGQPQLNYSVDHDRSKRSASVADLSGLHRIGDLAKAALNRRGIDPAKQPADDRDQLAQAAQGIADNAHVARRMAADARRHAMMPEVSRV